LVGSRGLPGLAVLAGIDAVRQQLAGLVPMFPCLLQGDVRIDP
jgi:hypothetical protein